MCVCVDVGVRLCENLYVCLGMFEYIYVKVGVRLSSGVSVCVCDEFVCVCICFRSVYSSLHLCVWVKGVSQ